MRILSILVISLFLVGCGEVPELPEFPGIKDHYLVEVRDEEVSTEVVNSIVNLDEIPRMESNQVVRCLHFEIISRIPYKIRFVKEEVMKECHLVGGYKPKDSISIYNWLVDAKEKIAKYRKCFKQ